MEFRKFFPGRSKGDQPAGSKSSRLTASLSDSYVDVLPEHVVAGNFCRGDDISSIHIGGSVSSPPLAGFDRPNRSTAELNFVVGRVLREEAEEEGMEMNDDDDQRTFDQTTLDGVEIYNSRDDYSTLSVDMSMFSLSLLKSEIGPDYEALSERIVKNSLRRHLELHFDAKKGKDETRPSSPASKINIDDCLQKDPDKVENLAQELITCVKYDQAIGLYKLLLEAQRKNPHGETADTLGKLSILCLLVGNREASLSYGKRALKLNREESRQAQVAISLMMIGLIYFGGDKPDKALRTWREALQTTCLVFGYDHPYVAILLNNLGCLHYHEGDFAVSLKTFSESLDLNRKFLGSSVGSTNSILLDIAFTKGNIATITARNGNLESAVSLLEEVLALQESVIPDSGHFLIKTTVITIDRLTGRHEMANPAPASPFHRPFLGTTSIASKTQGTSLAPAVQTCDSFQLIQVEDFRPSVFGDSDGIPMRRIGAKSPLYAMDLTDTLDVIMLGSLVDEYTPRQRVRVAVLSWFGKTLQDDEDQKLPFVPFSSTPRKRMNIPVDLDQDTIIDAELYLQGVHEQAADYLEHDEIDEALELFKSVLSSHRDKYGEMHHLVGTANHNIGLIYLFAQQYAQAMAFFQEAVTVREAALGSEHPAVAASLMKIGMIFLLRRDPETAKNTFFRVLKLVRKSLGQGHIQVARVLNNIAVAQYDQGAYLDAFRTFQEAHEIQRRLLLLSQSESSLLNQTKTIELTLSYTLSNISFLYCRQKKYKDSLRMLQEADKLRRKHVDISQPDIGCVDDNLLYVRALVGDIDRKDLIEQNDAGDNFFKMLYETTMDRINSPLRC